MWNLRLVDSTPSPDPYRLPGPKAIVVGIDASTINSILALMTNVGIGPGKANRH